MSQINTEWRLQKEYADEYSRDMRVGDSSWDNPMQVVEQIGMKSAPYATTLADGGDYYSPLHEKIAANGIWRGKEFTGKHGTSMTDLTGTFTIAALVAALLFYRA